MAMEGGDQAVAATIRAAELAWSRVVDVHAIEASRRADTAKVDALPDEVVTSWHAHSKSEFIAAWQHLSAMLDSNSIRDEYANYLASPSTDVVRRTLDALGVDVSALLAVSRSDDALRTFREQNAGVEGVLVACLGHYLARPRALSIKLLNAVYDCHDWCVSSPLEPLVTTTGERFVVDVWTTESPAGIGSTGQSSDEERSGAAGVQSEAFRFLVSGPPFDPAGAVAATVSSADEAMRRGAPASIMTMHKGVSMGTEDVWVPAMQDPSATAGAPEADANRPANISTATLDGKQYMKVTATRIRLSLAPFPRCGFYDWRLAVVSSDGSVRPATMVQPLSQMEIGAAVASGYLPNSALSTAAPHGNMSPQGLPHGLRTDGIMASSRSTSTQGGPHSSLLPLTALAQGRAIVHRQGLADEHWHEAVVDLVGMTFTEDGKVTQHGTFAGLTRGLGALRAQGVTSLIVTGAMERDNGWGEREPEASASPTPANVQGPPSEHAARVDAAALQPQMPSTSLAGFQWPAAGQGAHGDRISDSGSEFGFIELTGDQLQPGAAPGALGLLQGGRAITFGTAVPGFQVAIEDGQAYQGGVQLPGDALPAGVRAYAMRPDANPYAVVDRITPNRMLGGAIGFVQLVREAAALGMRVVVQAEASTSASRPHRKYRQLYCHTLDMRGQAVVHAGTDACENQWEDQQLLNYRKLETWELLVSEAKTLVQNLGVSGLYLPDAQSFPFIMALDTGELWRRDVDGEGHYTPREILEGHVVIANAEVGYWSTKAAKSYPNPLLVKMCKAMWAVDPQFAIIGESHWGRAGALARSGIIPHGLDLVSAVSATLGRFVDKMGAMRPMTLPNDIGPVHFLRALLDGEPEGMVPPQAAPHARDLLDNGQFPHPLKNMSASPAGPMPRGAARLQLRSICSNRLPYPALLLGRSAWTAVDLMYTLPGMPCTFGEESVGRAYRVDLAGTYAPNAAYLEQERRKREKRLQAEKHNRKFWERATTAPGPPGGAPASIAGSQRSMSMLGSGLTGTGLLQGTGGPTMGAMVTRPSMLHLALHSMGPMGLEQGSWEAQDVHMGAGGVVPAPPPPSGGKAGQPHGPSGLGRSGFSHLDLQSIGALAAGIATGAGKHGRPLQASAAAPGHFAAPPPVPPAGLSGSRGTVGTSSSPALNMLLQGSSLLESSMDSSMPGPSQEAPLGSLVPWGATPTHGQHTVPFFSWAPGMAGMHPGHVGHTLPPGEHYEGPDHGVGLPDDEDAEDEGLETFTSIASTASAHSRNASARLHAPFGFALAGRTGSGVAITTARSSTGRIVPPPVPGHGLEVSTGAPEQERPTTTTSRPSSAKGKGDVTKVQSWVPQGGLRVFGEHGGGWHQTGDVKEAIKNMRTLEDRLRYEVGPEYGFDLAKISAHYEHRRAMRARYRVLRDGDMRVLVARHRFGEHGHVFSFSRSIPGAVAVVALNFNGHPSTFAVDTSPLANVFGATTTADASASVQHLISTALQYGDVLRRKLAASDTKPGGAAGLSLNVASTGTLPSLNLKGGVWEVRNIFESDVVTSGTEGAAGRMVDGSNVAAGLTGATPVSDADGPLVAILASDEAAYAPTMTTLAPHRSYCWLFAACAGSGSASRPPVTPSLGTAAGASGWDRDAEVGPAAMQWLFASSLLRLQAMLRLKETGLASLVISTQEVEAAGGYIPLLRKREPGVGEPWVSPGEMLKDEEIQTGVRHNLVYSLLRGVVKRTFRSLLSARRAAAEAGEDGGQGAVGQARMKGVVQECAELLEGALRVVVTHLKLQEGPTDPHPNAGRRGPPILVADPLPPLHGAMHGAAAAPKPPNRPVDPHASWYGVDPEVASVIIRSALFMAVKDVVAQASGTTVSQDATPAHKTSASPTAGPGPADVSDEDATLSALLVKGLVRVARGQVTGAAAAAFADTALADGAGSLDPGLGAAVNKELAVMALARRLVWRNHLGPIVFVTPELGKWSTVGGLGVMVDELSVGLAELGAEVICISPYYHLNRKGVADYLAADGIQYTSRNVTVWVGGERVEMGVHEGVVKDVRLLFLHNPLTFPKPYPPHDAYNQTRVMASFAKGTLELLCQWRLIPGLVVTNDWFTGLVPAYARNPKFFGNVFNRTDFLHIAHNLNPDYEGRLWPDRSQGTLQHVHELDSHLLVDPYWQDVVINPTRAALLCSDSWATVSRSYRGELLHGSPLRALLRLAPHPFAHPNGIPVKARQSRLNSLPGAKSHDEAKAILQHKYFGMEHPDLSIPLFAFVGRITLQKGVHLILESADALLAHANGRAHFLVGGMASESDSYGRHCAGMMGDLRGRHGGLFWADPGLFFTDGDLVNLGADFCMMPSVFEPGGIVQQEFFVAGTPVIAFKTGGLKDTVHEWNAGACTGNGFVFEQHNAAEFQAACRRALAVYSDRAQYESLRANSRASVMDLSIVCQAWYREFHRLRRCLPPPPHKPITRVPVRFQLRLNEVPGASVTTKVYVAGSFNGWSAAVGKRLTLNLNHNTGMFEGIVQLMPGVYTYKFILDMGLPATGAAGEGSSMVWCTTPDAPLADDGTGNMNNVIHVLAPPTLPEDDE